MVRSYSFPCYGPAEAATGRRQSIYIPSEYDGQVQIYPTSVPTRASICTSLIRDDANFVPSHAGKVTCPCSVRIWTPRIAHRTHKCTWV
ncbi:hypothetical protein RvY_05978 [Ramazzottius varieornatus]|uniref:Uncharacterized protein n=1 Tax=Ramazzottius varieornatus TaxID=947166 RepID=A0A1D1V2G0_RAMVA|nr:hypothetical protein RvY_05978 [Ramazzottius varieornatus]